MPHTFKLWQEKVQKGQDPGTTELWNVNDEETSLHVQWHQNTTVLMLTLELKNLGKGRMTSAKDPANSHTRMMSLKDLGEGCMTSKKGPC